MDLPKFTPPELIEELEDMARETYADTFPHFEREELIETEAAEMIRTMFDALTRIAAGEADAVAIAKKALI